METSSELFAVYIANSDNILSRTVTGDEPRIHHWDLVTKQEPMLWKHANSPPPTAGSFALSCRLEKSWPQFSWIAKVCCWWIDYLPHKTTMTGPCYSELLKKLRQAVKEKRRGMLTRCPLLLHDNAPAHVSSCTCRIV